MEEITGNVSPDKLQKIRQYIEEMTTFSPPEYVFCTRVLQLFLADRPEAIPELEKITDIPVPLLPGYIYKVISGYPVTDAMAGMFRELGGQAKDFYGFLRSIRENGYTDTQTDEVFSALLDKVFRPEAALSAYLEEFRSSVLSAREVVNVIRNSLRLKEKYGVKILECFLEHKDEIAAGINRYNLSVLQKRYGTEIEIWIFENRLCRKAPKPSGSVYKTEENIKKIWTYRDGRDVYEIHRRYSIPVKDTSSLAGYRSAFNWAEKMKFNPNARKNIICRYPPHVTPDTVAYICNLTLAYYKLRGMAEETEKIWNTLEPEGCEKRKRPDVSGLLYDFTTLYYPLFRDGIFDVFKKILEQELPFSGRTSVHDLLYPYLGLPGKLLTPSVVKHLLGLPVRQLEEEWGFLESLRTVAENKEKTFRKVIYNSFRKGMTPEEIRQVCDRCSEQEIIKEYNLSHEQLKMVTEYYLPVIRKYRQKEMSPVQFLRIFGKNGIRTVLKPEKDCVFQPADYRLPSMEKTVLASLVNERLGTLENQEGLPARRRLYHRLDSICPVQDILMGRFREEDIPRIKKAMNLSENKELSLAGNFSAKIEEKCSPEFLIAGDASVCCMGLGSEKAVDYALNPGFGIFNVYFRDRIIANSLLWVNNRDTLVIDNIEVHPNYKQHKAYITEMYHQMIKDMHKCYPNIVQGSSYNDLELYTGNSRSGKLGKWNPEGIKGNFYSDAKKGCYLIEGDNSVFMSPEEDKELVPNAIAF